MMQPSFQKTEYFRGTVFLAEPMTYFECDCELITDRLNHHEVVLKCTTTGMQAINFAFSEIPDRIHIEGFLTQTKKILIEANFKSARNNILYFRCQEVYRYSDTVENNLDLEYFKKDMRRPATHFAWFLPDYYNIGWKNRLVQHPQMGLLANVTNSIKMDGGPHWGDIAQIKVAGEEYRFNHFLHFAESKQNDTVITHVVSDVRVSLDYEEPEFPSDWSGIRQRFEKTNDKFESFHLAFRFLYGYRLTSYCQVMFYFNPVTKRYVAISRDRTTSRTNRVNAYREKGTKGDWAFIEEFAEHYLKLEPEPKKLIKRCIERYSEAMEAPYLELKLTLLHSALSIYLDQDIYGQDIYIIIKDELPHFDKRAKTLRRLANYIAIHKTEWVDLIPDGYDKSVLFEFNTLRNAYLKRSEHKIKEVAPVRILQKLFERLLLTALGIDYTKHKRLLGLV